MHARIDYRPPRPIFLGFALVTIGVLFLLRELDVLPDISVWTFIWLGLGGWLLIGNLVGTRKGWFWPLTLVLIGTVMLLRDLEVVDQDFAIWPVVVLSLGLAILLNAFTTQKPRRHSEPWVS
jgi:hypothetical protein